jgi:hypothetical protein
LPAKPRPPRRKPRRTHALTKLYADPPGEDSIRLPRNEVRALIQNRESFLANRLSLLELADAQRDALEQSAELEDVMRMRALEMSADFERGVRAPELPTLPRRVARLYAAIGAARPIPRAVWQNRDDSDSEADEEDEIEDDAAAGGGHSGAAAASPAAQAGGAQSPLGAPEQLRDATPAAAAASPGLELPALIAGRRTSGAGAADALPADGADSQPQHDEEFDMPQPDADMNMELPPGPEDNVDFEQPDPVEDDATAPSPPGGGPFDTDPAAAGLGFDADGGVGFTQPEASQPEDESLSAHTLATLERLKARTAELVHAAALTSCCFVSVCRSLALRCAHAVIHDSLSPQAGLNTRRASIASHDALRQAWWSSCRWRRAGRTRGRATTTSGCR